MSIKIIKKGLADSIQDNGRYGYQHLGIPPAGCMDIFSAWLANKIIGNNLYDAVFEFHFPSSQIIFEKEYTICITGANFVPVINDKSVELNTPINVHANDKLTMLQPIEGRTSYMAVCGNLNNHVWLGSQSYSIQSILNEDLFEFQTKKEINKEATVAKKSDFKLLIETIQKWVFDYHTPIHIIPGAAWSHLNEASVIAILNNSFTVTSQANRMGFQLAGTKLSLTIPNNFLSSGVTRGTLQLLPSGEIIVLMADHQTIGGYANLGQIILVDLPRFAQLKTGQSFHFALTNLDNANQLYRNMYEKFQH